MKNLTFILLAIFCFSCKKGSVRMTGLENSRRTWETYKASVNNSYTYIRYFEPDMGPYAESTITVQNGKVIGRTFKKWEFGKKPTNSVEQVSWTEDAATLNTHTDGYVSAMTVDQLYDEAKRDYVTVDLSKNDFTFQTDGRGLMKICGYQPKRCDDCFTGITIKNIQPIK